MLSSDEILNLVNQINALTLDNTKIDEKNDQFWFDAAANIMIFSRHVINHVDMINKWIPKEYGDDCHCLINSLFTVANNLSRWINLPFENTLWESYLNSLPTTDSNLDSLKKSSLYELLIAHISSLICLLYANRFKYAQILLIKHIFGMSEICSLMAADVYCFIVRVVNPNHKVALCQILMNICKFAPPQQVVAASALINRILDQLDGASKKLFMYKNRYPECIMHFLQI